MYNREFELEFDRQNREQTLAAIARDGADDIVVCCWRLIDGQQSPFDDNVDGVCARCNIAIYHRPWIPEAVRKLCLPCTKQEHREWKQREAKRNRRRRGRR